MPTKSCDHCGKSYGPKRSGGQLATGNFHQTRFCSTSCYGASKRRWESNRQRSLWYKYGITLDDYAELLQRQGGVCAICNGTDTHKFFNVDHDHETGKVRGLLCWNCNTMLGKLEKAMRNNAGVLKSVENYLKGV